MGDVGRRVGQNIARLRRQRVLTQDALAQVTGLKQTYLSELENGKRNPTLGTLSRIAEALRVDIAELTAP